MLQTEPELLLPKLTVESDNTLALVAGFLTPYLARETLTPGMDVHQAADFLARMVLSHIAAPGRWDLEDPEQVATWCVRSCSPAFWPGRTHRPAEGLPEGPVAEGFCR